MNCKYDIFLSYRGVDTESASLFNKKLKECGFSTFFADTSIHAEKYSEVIPEAIKSSKYFIFFITQNIFTKQQNLISELEIAFQNNIPMIFWNESGLSKEDICSQFLSLEYYIGATQVIDSRRSDSFDDLLKELGSKSAITNCEDKNTEQELPWKLKVNDLLKSGELKPSDTIRCSYAAGLVVEVYGKYLLVLNSHGMNKYQLPAHTYRIKDAEQKNYIISKFNATRSNDIKRDYDDFRFRVPVEHLSDFYDYFRSLINPYEFDTSYLLSIMLGRTKFKNKIFKDASITFRSRYFSEIAYKGYFDTYEMNIFDTYVLNLNEEQTKYLFKKSKSIFKNKNYRFNTLNEIKHNGINTEKHKLVADITENTYFALISNTKDI